MAEGIRLRLPCTRDFPGFVAAVVSTAELEKRRLAQAPSTILFVSERFDRVESRRKIRGN